MSYQVKARTLGNDNMGWGDLQYPLIASIKYDGRSTIVHKQGEDILYETSGGHIFRLEHNHPFDLLPDGHYFAEMMGENIPGKKGDRVHSGIQTTFVTNTKKGIKNYKKPTWRVFSYLTRDEYSKGSTQRNYLYILDALGMLEFDTLTNFVVDYEIVYDEIGLRKLYSDINAKKWEGLMLATFDLKWNNSTRRLKTLVKLKDRPTMKAICIDVLLSEDTKYAGQIGSLLLRLQDGKTFKCGSGLSDMDRVRSHDYFVGNPIEIQYEQLINGVPQQPVYIDVRETL